MNSGHQAIIFLVEEDEETRRLLKRNLEEAGYHVLLALDEEDARDRVGDGRLVADLILVNLVGAQPDEALQAGRRIRQEAELAVPLVIMAEKYGADVEGTDVNAGGDDWITYPEDHEQLENLLARLLDERPPPGDAREHDSARARE
jgi:DNA-binding response OmpR family regulator